MEEKWPGPAGLIPVTSGRSDDANLINRHYLDQLMVEMRVIDAIEPNMEVTLFGEKFSSPIMMPAFSHLNKVGENGRMPMEEYAYAAKQLNVLNWVGMEDNETFAKISSIGAKTVRIIKPFMDHDKIKGEIDCAKACGAIAVGIDIDHVPGENGKYDVVDGYALGPITLEDLKAYVAYAGIPFVAKGVLSVQDAIKAKEAGCAAIVVSHHHGRIPFGIPPVYVLPAICEALQGTGVKVFCDCGIDDGYDAYKALALGADAVSVGRGILRPLLQEGEQGVIKKVNKMNEELAKMMMYTNVHDCDSFDASVIHKLY